MLLDEFREVVETARWIEVSLAYGKRFTDGKGQEDERQQASNIG
jgi:hypothetical protein